MGQGGQVREAALFQSLWTSMQAKETSNTTLENSTLAPTLLLYDPQSHRCYSPASGNTSLTCGRFDISFQCHLQSEERDRKLKKKRKKKARTNTQNNILTEEVDGRRVKLTL